MNWGKFWKPLCNIIGNSLKMIITILIIFIFPFIMPVFLKVLLKWHIFNSVEDFRIILELFNNTYIIAYIIIGILILLGIFHNWDDIKQFIGDRNFLFDFHGTKLSAEKKINDMIELSNDRKEFVNGIKNESKKTDIQNVTEEAKQKLGLLQQTNNEKCKDCNKDDLEKENNNFRYFAAYNIINMEAKQLLHVIYNENYVDLNNFKSGIIQGYKKRNKKNVKFSKQDISKVANNKYETIFEGLKFLNIIEPSEDDKIIKLTKNGKEFVEKYIEEKEV